MLFSDLTWVHFVLSALITGFAGFTKGVTGFALPLIMVSGMASYLPADFVIGTMIIPTLVSNLWQALRQGWREALGSLRKHRLLIVVTISMIFISALWVRTMPQELLFALLGLVVTVTSLVQLAGVRIQISAARQNLAAVITGLIAGFFGAISGTWGPPIVIYLLAIGTGKIEQVRATGVAFAAGALVLTFSHTASGLLSRDAFLFSLCLMPAMILGMMAGGAALDRIDPERFRKIVLGVLLIAGLNILRRAAFG